MSLLAAHPEGLTIRQISRYLGMHRHTARKYVYRLIGARAIDLRKVSAAKLCYLSEETKKTGLAEPSFQTCWSWMLKPEQSRVLKDLSERISKIEGILLAMVFGSFARGDYGPGSDIDLLVVAESGEADDKVRDELMKRTEDFDRSVRPVIRCLGELKKTDTDLLKKIFREGKIISIKGFVEFDAHKLLNLKPFRLCSFDVSGLKRSAKVKFSRTLYGRRVGKYSYSGIIHRVDGIKLGKGSVLVPEERSKEIHDFFKAYGAKVESWEVFA